MQSHPPDEVIVVDDGSSDRTVGIVQSYNDRLPLRLLEPGRVGRAVALNEGVAVTDADLIAILDADDASFARRIENEIRVFEQEGSLGMCGSSFVQVLEPEMSVSLRSFPQSHDKIARALAYSGPFCHSTVMYRRDAIERAGGFDSSRRSRIDQDLWVRIGALGFRYANLAEPLGIHVKGPGSYFARVNTLRTRTGTMLARNLKAVSALSLPKRYVFAALARAAWSFLPNAVSARLTAGSSEDLVLSEQDDALLRSFL
jgi:glycosyltransferase involved in cell wall biosynthesis